MRLMPFSCLSGLGAASLLWLAAPALADVKAGVDAWQRGDHGVAVKEWRPLAERGNADAQFNMGQAYRLGRGVSSDLRIAQSWYEKAAQQGHEEAQANLGVILYQNGRHAAAMPWIVKAANYGDARAQYILGTVLFNGSPLPRDWPRAYALMTRAAGQGMPQAATSLNQMEKHIPALDRQRGIALAQQMQNGAPAYSAAPALRRPVRTAAATPAQTRTPPPRVTPPSGRPMPPVRTAAAPSARGWRVQLGAFGSPSLAQSQWATIRSRVPGIASLSASYEPAGSLTRLRVGPLSTKAAADRLCASAKAAGQACFPVAPSA
jgi:cell division septation protein DedD